MGYSLRQFRNMVADRTRVGAYLRAMEEAIQPGDLVADIGTGTGVTAFAALALGARHVVAIEPDPIVELGRREAARRGVLDQVTFVEGFSTDYQPEQKFDVIVADLRDTLPCYPGNISSITDARERLLRPGGVLLPERDTFFACPVAPHASLYQQGTDQTPWIKSWDLPVVDLTFPDLDLRTRNEPVVTKASSAQPLAIAKPWAVYNYRETTSPNVAGELMWRLDQPGTLGGFQLWFDGVIAPGHGFSNAPGQPDLVYGNLLLETSEYVSVDEGDNISLQISSTEMSGQQIYRWRTEVFRGDRTIARFDQSTFDCLPVVPR